ncbi:hypothetical protein DFO47_105140 [Arthrobacter sp. AG258]|uniref:hypothetical protein n=1 Tax=Arthrobacter sp. AG258 TaxID=2183899 RepID=UPI00105E6849|nr:hypothetical protein [Arthrobacter sp. AG258]TDT79344.1 hypothetical protein DFO47_105140 [Arthrobacter sp. AG258]
MTAAASDLDRLLLAIAKIPTPWKEWPGGYPTRLDLALIDAVMSIRFRYGRERSDGSWTGVRGAVLRYQKYSEHVAHDEKMRYLASQDPVALEKVLNRQKVHAGKTKTSAIVEAAHRFVDIGVTEPEDLRPDNAEHRRQYIGVSGLGPITWEYLTMLLHSDGVKADTWITRFVQQALQRSVSTEEAGALVKVAAQELEVTEKSLDHAIWSYASTGGLRINLR